MFLHHVEEKEGRFDIGGIAWRSLAQLSIRDEVKPDERGHHRLPRNDDELVDRGVG